MGRGRVMKAHKEAGFQYDSKLDSSESSDSSYHRKSDTESSVSDESAGYSEDGNSDCSQQEEIDVFTESSDEKEEKEAFQEILEKQKALRAKEKKARPCEKESGELVRKRIDFDDAAEEDSDVDRPVKKAKKESVK